MQRSGEYISNLTGEAMYKSFRPAPLPPVLNMDDEMVSQLTSATKALATLDTLSSYIPNMNLFVSMYVRKEALLSSQIEGTQATLEDVLDPLIEKNANQNVADVVNYIKAAEFALERMNTLPLCNRLIKETHAVLMSGVRGQEKNPGEFRTSQNWIGAAGSSLKNARYIPPNPEDMINAMSDLEKYINSDDSLDVLIQAALLHYQFETIHPFLDGNGRVGRLLITLFLMEKGVLNSPALYISYYLKKNRIEYAQYRSRQLVSNFAHSTADQRAAATALQYGEYVDPSVFGGSGQPYYRANAREAIAKAGYVGTIDEVAMKLATLVKNSQNHWNYIGDSQYCYIAVGVTYESDMWYCAITVASENTDEY